MNTANFKDITYERDAHGIVTLRFNRLERKNALSMYSFYELYCAIDAFEQDELAYAMILTGANDPAIADPAKQVFSSGGYFNPDALDGLPTEVLAKLDLNDIAQKRITLKMFLCDKPILAAVNGAAIGGAVTLALATCDQIYMAEDAWLQLPFAKLGICAELASSFLLPRLLGLQKAKQIMFFAERIDATTAQNLHLANAVVAHDDLLSFTHAKALQLVPPHGAPRSISAMKKLLREPLIADVTDALDRENAALAELFKSTDFAEALAARQARRAPQFTGR